MSFNNPLISSYRDAFLIDTTHTRRLNNDWPDGNLGYPGTYGWFAGGSNNGSLGAVSYVDRIDFANDSSIATSPRGPLSLAKRSAAAGNANYGWFGGGAGNPATIVLSTVDRIDYSSDSPSSASPRGLLSQPRYLLGATGNANYGWFIGGFTPGPSAASTVDRIDYSNDSPTTASPRGQFPGTVYSSVATANANYGWWTGGYSSSQVQRIDFSNDSPLTSGRALQPAVIGGQGATSNANYGWFVGGAPGPFSSVNRIDFANDTVNTSPRGPLSLARKDLAGAGNTNYGWFGGGQPPSGVSTIDRIDFANDSPTSASPRGPLSSARYGMGGTSNYVKSVPGLQLNVSLTIPNSNGTFAWNIGGSIVPANYSTVDRIDFSNDSPAVAGARTAFPIIRYFGSGLSNSYFGWWGGGADSGGFTFSTVYRTDFSNDASISTRGSLSTGMRLASSSGNTNYGWFAGGGTVSITRVDYANDNITASPRGNLPVTGQFATGNGNANYGWHLAGGFTTGVYRIDYSNDSPTAASSRASLNTARAYMTSTGNADYGWFGAGGTPGPVVASSLERITYSNDTITPSVRGLLTAARQQLSAASSANYGWYVGGMTDAAGVSPVSTIDRIDFSNDSPTSASPRGPLSQTRYNTASTSNYSKTLQTTSQGGRIDGTFGWSGGGFTPTVVSTVERVDFSNDSPTAASVRGSLSIARRDGQQIFIGNANYGWVFGGIDAPGAIRSDIDRINFSNDSPTTASARGKTINTRGYSAATGNANYGWVGSGFSGSAGSSIERIDYNNDLISTTIRGILAIGPSGVYYGSATATANYGYWGGGYQGAVSTTYSTVARIDFSNDSPTSSSTRGSLSTARYGIGAVSNTNYGWFGGGNNSGSIIDRVDFSNDSPASASIRGPLNSARYASSAFGNANYGWWVSGNSPGSRIERIDYSNDSPTGASIRGPLSANRYRMLGGASNYVKAIPITNKEQYYKGSGTVGTGNGTYGWHFAGRGSGGIYSSVDRIDFANDSPTTAAVRGALTGVRYGTGAASNASFGWVSGGITPTLISNIDRIDFANDLTTSLSRGFLTTARRDHYGFSNTSYGWFSGGFPGFFSTVERIDFSNDSPAGSISRGGLSAVSGVLSAATSNQYYGWKGGGNTPGGVVSAVDRINFSNDTLNWVIRGPLTASRANLAATGNALYGWFAGGGPNPGTTTVERIDFSNDSPTSASPRGPLLVTRFNHAASGNTDFGWFSGGYIPAPTGFISSVDRIAFATDTATATARGIMAATRYRHSSISNYTK